MKLLEAITMRRLWRKANPEAAALWLGETMRLEARRALLAAELERPTEPGEIRPRYVERVRGGPVPVINLRRRAES